MHTSNPIEVIGFFTVYRAEGGVNYQKEKLLVLLKLAVLMPYTKLYYILLACYISSFIILSYSSYSFIHLIHYSFLLSMSHNIPFLSPNWLLFGFVKGSKSQSEKPPLPPLFCHAVLFVSISPIQHSFNLWKKCSSSAFDIFLFLQEISIFRKSLTKHI